jgi:hypothetical protein
MLVTLITIGLAAIDGLIVTVLQRGVTSFAV